MVSDESHIDPEAVTPLRSKNEMVAACTAIGDPVWHYETIRVRVLPPYRDDGLPSL